MANHWTVNNDLVTERNLSKATMKDQFMMEQLR